MNHCLLPPSLFFLSLTILTQLSGGHCKLTSLPSAASHSLFLWDRQTTYGEEKQKITCPNGSFKSPLPSC